MPGEVDQNMSAASTTGRIFYSPAPKIELAIFAMESNNPPPAVRLAAIASRSRSRPFASFNGNGLSKDRREESSKPTMRGILGLICPRGVLVISGSSSISSLSSSYSARSKLQQHNQSQQITHLPHDWR